MALQAFTGIQKRLKADALIVPFFQGKKEPDPVESIGEGLLKTLPAPVWSDFEGQASSFATAYAGEIPETRLILIGLGKQSELTADTVRRAYAAPVSHCIKKKYHALNIIVPKSYPSAAAEGVLSLNYAFDYKDEEKSQKAVQTLRFYGCSSQALKQAEAVSYGVYLTRDLVNGNADEVTPESLARTAQALAEQPKTSVKIFKEKELRKLGMGLLLAVGRASPIEPRLIVLSFKGDPKSKDHTVLVGKGVTYDTGGLNLKTGEGMLTMKRDMAGAGAVLGVIKACQKLGLKRNVTAVIPTTENSIDSRSYKPGDVYRSFSGKTVEIGNTDAEGRLILADALAYAVKELRPTRLIDLATLTGAVVIALGRDLSGLMSSDDLLAEQLLQAGEASGELLARLPLHSDYRRHLESPIADISNVGGREAATITAALFLKEFVGDVPWAHLDIAGTAHLEKAHGSRPAQATGVGVRLLMAFLA